MKFQMTALCLLLVSSYAFAAKKTIVDKINDGAIYTSDSVDCVREVTIIKTQDSFHIKDTTNAFYEFFTFRGVKFEGINKGKQIDKSKNEFGFTIFVEETEVTANEKQIIKTYVHRRAHNILADTLYAFEYGSFPGKGTDNSYRLTMKDSDIVINAAWGGQYDKKFQCVYKLQ